MSELSKEFKTRFTEEEDLLDDTNVLLEVLTRPRSAWSLEGGRGKDGWVVVRTGRSRVSQCAGKGQGGGHPPPLLVVVVVGGLSRRYVTYFFSLSTLRLSNLSNFILCRFSLSSGLAKYSSGL